MHRAGAAGGDAAAEFGAGELEMLAQHPEQRRVRRGIDFMPLSVDGEDDHRTPPWARRSCARGARTAFVVFLIARRRSGIIAQNKWLQQPVSGLPADVC